MAIINIGSVSCEIEYAPPKNQGRTLVYALTRVLIAAGWSAVQTSNGSTVIANDWGVSDLPARAWGCFRAPSGVELVLETTNNDWALRAWYSREKGFAGGDAAVAPVAEDQVQLVGVDGAFDATFIWESTGANVYAWTIMADSARWAGASTFSIVGHVVGSKSAHRAVMFSGLALDSSPRPAPGAVRNRVWDMVAKKHVSWGTSADPTGESYPGPGVFGADTADYCLVKRGRA